MSSYLEGHNLISEWFFYHPSTSNRVSLSSYDDFKAKAELERCREGFRRAVEFEPERGFLFYSTMVKSISRANPCCVLFPPVWYSRSKRPTIGNRTGRRRPKGRVSLPEVFVAGAVFGYFATPHHVGIPRVVLVREDMIHYCYCCFMIVAWMMALPGRR